MKTIKIIQLCAGLAALAALVGAELIGVSLSAELKAMLSLAFGWTMKRPSELLPER